MIDVREKGKNVAERVLIEEGHERKVTPNPSIPSPITSSPEQGDPKEEAVGPMSALSIQLHSFSMFENPDKNSEKGELLYKSDNS